VRIDSSAPTRIDLAGGTLDIWPLYLFHDRALTLNAAITLRARCSIVPRAGSIRIHSADTGETIDATDPAGVAADGAVPLLARLVRHFGAGDLELVTWAESPVGAGIAGSSAMNIAVCGALAAWTGRTLSPDAVMTTAMNVEAQVIRVSTGVQDYRPAFFGGVAAVELGVEGVRRVPLDVDPGELERRLVLAYTGASRHSGMNNWEALRRHLDGDAEVFDRFERIRDTAVAMRDALERADWPEVGRQIAAEWENRKALAPGVTTPLLERLVARARRAGAAAAKVCGAGGGGCLICFGEPAARSSIRDALTAEGARVLDFRIDMQGLRVNVESDHDPAG